MLKNISATNFRGFKSLDVDLAPITIFVGANNSGKSSIVSLVRLLSQTLDSNDPNVRLLLNGALGDFGTYKDLINENQTRKNLDIGFTLQPSEKNRNLGCDKDSISYKLKYKYRSAIKEIVLKRLESWGDGKHHLSAEFNEDSERFLLRKVADKLIAPTSAATGYFRGFSVRNFLPRFNSIFAPPDSETATKSAQRSIRASVRNALATTRVFQALEYVGAMRMPPSRTYLYTGERRQKVGANGEHALTMLAMDSIRRGSKSRGIRAGVVKWLTAAGIASDIKVVPVSERYFEIHVQHPITKEYQNFADVGYGNSQVIPVLVAGLNASEGSVFLAEEPEIHLHPKAQSELGDFFLDLYDRGVQSIIETHSEHMIIRLQTHIAAGKLSPKDIFIYFVEPTPQGKKLIRLELDEDGAFKQDFPGGFFPERLNGSRALAVERAKRVNAKSDMPRKSDVPSM